MGWDIISQSESTVRAERSVRSEMVSPGNRKEDKHLEAPSQAASREKQADKSESTEENQQKNISQDFLEQLEKEISLIHNVGLKFSVHQSTGRTMVKVINKDSGRTIREIPPERILDLAAKLDEMIGIIFDKIV